jgi:YD repeat-containing protein
MGTQIEEIDANGGTTQTLVDQFGNVTAQITQLGHRSLKFYDLQGRLVKEKDAVGNATTYTYDSFGRKLTATDALGNVTSYTYDQRDRLTSVTDALNNTESFAYDGRNNRISTLYPLGQRTDQVYDSLGRVIDTQVYLNGKPTDSQSAYDAYGNLISETDAMGRTKTHVYGAFGRLIEDIDEDGNAIAYNYDVYGRRTNAYDPNTVTDPTAASDPSHGKDIQTTYNQAGQITSVNDLATHVSTTYTYDLLGHRLTEDITTPVSDANRNMTYQYDKLGQLVYWVNSITGENLRTQYDAEGNVARVYTDGGYDPLGQNTSGNINFRYIDHVYTYDADRRVTQEVQRTTDASGNISDSNLNAYEYDAGSNKISWTNESTTVTYTYDADGRVKEGDYYTGSDLNQQEWTYDAMGNVKTYTTLKNGSVSTQTVNTYNDENRTLTSSNTSDGKTQVTTTTYDLTMRITQTVLQNNGKTYTYNYSYYGDGREKSVTAFGDAKGTTVSTYDVNKVQTGLNLGQGDNQDHAETKSFIADNDGHIIYETHDDGKNSDPIEHDQFLYANDNPVGQNVQGTDGKITVQLDSDSYAPIQNLSDSNPGSNLTYTVQNGDSLQSIASQMYGNASLWFVIAEANGLNAGDALKAGTQLLIPNTIQSGTITADNHKVYSATDIVGSTLPNLKSPPPPHHGGCGAILAIIIVVVVAVVVSIFAPELAAFVYDAAASVLGPLSTAASIALAVASTVVAGAVVGAIGSIVQQGLFIALGYQQKFSWKEVAHAAEKEAVQSLFSGGSTGNAIADAAIQVAGAASEQLVENGKITSWTGIAAAGLGGYLGTGSSLNHEISYVTPWVQLAETSIRNNGKLTPTDWATAVGGTLAEAVVNNVPGATDKTLSGQLENAALRVGTTALVAGALSHYDKNAAESYFDDNVGHEIGNFLKVNINNAAQGILPAYASPLEQASWTSIGVSAQQQDEAFAQIDAGTQASIAQDTAQINDQVSSDNQAYFDNTESAYAAAQSTGNPVTPISSGSTLFPGQILLAANSPTPWAYVQSPSASNNQLENDFGVTNPNSWDNNTTAAAAPATPASPTSNAQATTPATIDFLAAQSQAIANGAATGAANAPASDNSSSEPLPEVTVTASRPGFWSRVWSDVESGAQWVGSEAQAAGQWVGSEAKAAGQWIGTEAQAAGHWLASNQTVTDGTDVSLNDHGLSTIDPAIRNSTTVQNAIGGAKADVDFWGANSAWLLTRLALQPDPETASYDPELYQEMQQNAARVAGDVRNAVSWKPSNPAQQEGYDASMFGQTAATVVFGGVGAVRGVAAGVESLIAGSEAAQAAPRALVSAEADAEAGQSAANAPTASPPTANPTRAPSTAAGGSSAGNSAVLASGGVNEAAAAPSGEAGAAAPESASGQNPQPPSPTPPPSQNSGGSPIDYAHSIGADYSKAGNPTGGHSLLNGDVRIVPGTETAPDATGVYKATIQVPDPNNPGQWIIKTSNNSTNSMFPKDWDATRIQQEVDAAWNDPNKVVTGKQWTSFTPSGVKVQGYISPRTTVYPVYQGP